MDIADLRAKTRRLALRLSNVLDLPADTLVDVPRLTLIGNMFLSIENHRGLIEYAPEKIRAAVPTGVIDVQGQKLVVRQISTMEIYVVGQVERITISYER